MSCHMCWSEYYRLCKIKREDERNRRAAIKVRVQELKALGCNYGEAIWIATFGEDENATYSL